MCNFFSSFSHFLLLKFFFISNSTGYDFSVLNILQCKSDHEKSENYIIAKITGYKVYVFPHTMLLDIMMFILVEKKNYMTCVYKSATVHDIKQQRKQKELFMLLVSILVPV